MAYRPDKDLDFLKEVPSKELSVLVDILISKGSISESLTKTDGYRDNYPEHTKYWQDIASEIQLFGGNTFSNFFRGKKGVKYEEIIAHTCKILKVKLEKGNSVEEMEMKLIIKILSDSTQKMTEEELENLSKEFGIKDVLKSSITPIALQTAIKSSGFLAYKVSLIVANAITKQILGKGLTLAANQTLTKSISVFAGPVGWVFSGIWTLYDITGPASRVLIPAVIQIAFLRQQLKQES